MPDFTAHRHPVLAVRCPDCGRAPGIWCVRPSGHRASDLHLSRKAQADTVFIEQHGPDASVARIGDDWIIDPHGRAGIRTGARASARGPSSSRCSRSGAMTYEYRTPGTTLWWATVAQWTEAGWRIGHRRLSSARARAMEAHRGCLWRDVIKAETEIDAIDVALYLLIHGPAGVSRPLRGHRAGDPSTPVIVHLSNRRQALRRGRNEMPAGGNWKAVHGPAIS